MVTGLAGVRPGSDRMIVDPWTRAAGALRALYGERADFAEVLNTLRVTVETARRERSDTLKAWDADCSDPAWWLDPGVVGYSTYVDRFGGDLAGVEARLDYLSDLGVSYLHLLPFMKPRQGESDGGYAVADFEDVNPDLGDREQLKHLLSMAHTRGIRIVADLVCNHVADDHDWALRAKGGESRYRAFFHLVEEQEDVARWEANLGEVFPVSAPGNFTWSAALQAWVWTSFYPYQWDLNYGNPAVFLSMTDTMLRLANLGLSGFRLDSTGFLWKRFGTGCRNLPEVHLVLQAWRAILDCVAPAVVLKAEAIDRLEEVLPFFGSDAERECDVAYANGVMAASWASLAAGDATAVVRLIGASAKKPRHGAWINYIRCHDDVIFSGLSPHVPEDRQAAAALALTETEATSFGRGEVFQTFGGVPSITGMAASLTGADDPNDPWGVYRLLMLYGVCFSLDGLPLIYMGDEIALANDEDYRLDPSRAAEGRWLGRPRMDWAVAEGAMRGEPGVATTTRSRFKTFAEIRRRHPAFADRRPAEVRPSGDSRVLTFTRGTTRPLLVVANFSDAPIRLFPDLGRWIDVLADHRQGRGSFDVGPYGLHWLELQA